MGSCCRCVWLVGWAGGWVGEPPENMEEEAGPPFAFRPASARAIAQCSCVPVRCSGTSPLKHPPPCSPPDRPPSAPSPFQPHPPTHHTHPPPFPGRSASWRCSTASPRTCACPRSAWTCCAASSIPTRRAASRCSRSGSTPGSSRTCRTTSRCGRGGWVGGHRTMCNKVTTNTICTNTPCTLSPLRPTWPCAGGRAANGFGTTVQAERRGHPTAHPRGVHAGRGHGGEHGAGRSTAQPRGAQRGAWRRLGALRMPT